jgi:hypothetical protein
MTNAAKEAFETVSYYWPVALIARISDMARRRAVKERRDVSASEVAKELALLGMQKVAEAKSAQAGV